MYMPYVGAPPLFQLESWAQQTTGETFEALDLIVGKLADQIEQEKALKKAFKKQVLMIDDGKIFGWNFSAAKNHTLENLSKHIKAKYPQATILNTIPLEEAAQLVLALP